MMMMMIADLNLEFSFSWIISLTNDKEPRQPYYFPLLCGDDKQIYVFP